MHPENQRPPTLNLPPFSLPAHFILASIRKGYYNSYVEFPYFRTEHLHTFGESRRSISNYAETSADNLFAFIPVLPDGAFCTGGETLSKGGNDASPKHR